MISTSEKATQKSITRPLRSMHHTNSPPFRKGVLRVGFPLVIAVGRHPVEKGGVGEVRFLRIRVLDALARFGAGVGRGQHVRLNLALGLM
jgi:hypothetical protein